MKRVYKYVEVTCFLCAGNFLRRFDFHFTNVKKNIKEFCSSKCLSEFKSTSVERITFECFVCKKLIFKTPAEHAKAIKKSANQNYKPTCSVKCGAQYKPNKNIKSNFYLFGMIASNAKYSDKKYRREHNPPIDGKYLKSLWGEQKGICPVTGWEMIPPSANVKKSLFKNKHKANASLDRIDNSKGHVQGNVRFVCLMANYARNNFSDDELKEFCKAVASHSPP